MSLNRKHFALVLAALAGIGAALWAARHRHKRRV